LAPQVQVLPIDESQLIDRDAGDIGYAAALLATILAVEIEAEQAALRDAPALDEGVLHQLLQVGGNLDPESRASSFLALNGNGASHQLHGFLHDGQAQAGSFVPARRGTIDLLEALEDVGQVLRGDADAGIPYLHPVLA
jgi:hypothetical protein